jgi:UPF0042 nucleotide-binding protein
MSQRPQLIIITGMSGAGRSTAAKALEDLGWYVIDNLPPQLLAEVTTLISSGEAEAADVAVVVDARSRHFFADLRGILDQLRLTGLRLQILFVDARDDMLVRRQDAARRPHPLQSQGRLLDGIHLERELIRELRGDADIIIDTSELNVHQLAGRVARLFADEDAAPLHATLVSFGFKYGIPADADMVVDMRFLPNPYWDPLLRPQSGLDDPVRDSVLAQPRAAHFLSDLDRLLATVFDGFAHERKQFFCLAVGCTGGKHRSVVTSEEIARRLRSRDIETLVVHRDLGRE